MDILYLVDKLESLLDEGIRIPFTSNVVVNEEDYLTIIDQMRISIPEEVREARRVEGNRERVMAKAEEEAERIVAMAHEERERLLDEHEIIQEAQARADELLDEGHREARRIQDDADQYVIDVLTQLEQELASFQRTVHNGVEALEASRRQESEEAGGGSQSPLMPGDQKSTLS